MDDEVVDELAILEAELLKTPKEVIRSAELMLERKDLLIPLSCDLELMGVYGEVELAVMLYIVGTSRMLKKPLAAVVQGPSSAGKSYVTDCVAKLFPAEGQLVATSLTPQALIYAPKGYLKHKWVRAGERSRRPDDEVAETTRAWRELISNGYINRYVTTRNGDGHKSVLFKQEGPIAYTESTTMPKIFAEDSNRMLPLLANASKDQTRRVLNAIGDSYAGSPANDTEEVILRHHAAQRLLRREAAVRSVIVPFSNRIAEFFPDEPVQSRRAFKLVINAIQACALLHMFARDRGPDDAIIASGEDYRIVRQLLDGPIARQLGRPSIESVVERYDEISEFFDCEQCFTAQELAKKIPKDERTHRDHLDQLRKVGMVELVEQAKGQRPARWKLRRWTEQPTGTVLPPVEDVCFENRQSDNAQTPVPETVLPESGVSAGIIRQSDNRFSVDLSVSRN